MRENVVESAINNDFLTICLSEVEKEGAIFLYRAGIKVGKYVKSDPPFVEGYVELPHHY